MTSPSWPMANSRRCSTSCRNVTSSWQRPANFERLIWDCEHSKTPEGYYQARGSIDYAIAKSLAAAPLHTAAIAALLLVFLLGVHLGQLGGHAVGRRHGRSRRPRGRNRRLCRRCAGRHGNVSLRCDMPQRGIETPPPSAGKNSRASSTLASRMSSPTRRG